MNQLTPNQREAIGARGAAVGHPTLHVGFRVFEGPQGWERLLAPGRLILADDLAQIERQLASAEEQHAKRQENRPSERSADPDPDAYDPKEELARVANEEAARSLAFRATEAGRQERQIELLERIVAALESRQG
jgi:hypothetical protein